MPIRLTGGGSTVMRAPQRSDAPSASVSHNKVSIYLSGGSFNPAVLDDANVNTYTAANYYDGGSVMATGMLRAGVINLNPEIATIGVDGLINRVAPGVAKVVVKLGFISLPLTLDLTTKLAGSQPNEFVSTVAGSLAAHVKNVIDSRIDNTMTMGTNGLVFTTQNHTTQSYVRNENLWCADVDLTCISPWNSNGGATKAGTLITPRHVINAAHYEYNVGNTVRFVAMDGTVHNRTITGKKRHPDYVPYTPDLTVYTLASDLPATVTPCKLMPPNWSNYLVQNWYNRPPALGLDQEEKALIIDFNTNGSFRTPTDATRLIFHEDKIGGDSGNPAFLIVNDELVLVTVWTFGGAGSGTPVAAHIAALNQMIIDADTQAGVSTVDDPKWPNANGHYQLQPADFSAFPNYA